MARDAENDKQRSVDAEGAPSQQGASGGNLARKIGQRDEMKSAKRGDSISTTVDGRDKPDGSDRPTPPEIRE